MMIMSTHGELQLTGVDDNGQVSAPWSRNRLSDIASMFEQAFMLAEILQNTILALTTLEAKTLLSDVNMCDLQ